MQAQRRTPEATQGFCRSPIYSKNEGLGFAKLEVKANSKIYKTM
jgi:hypothetical protein